MPTLKCESERYSRYGNISAEGIQKLLGTPQLDRLQTVIRETVQNSWDARRDDAKPAYTANLRKLNLEQSKAMKGVFSDLPGSPDSESLIAFMEAEEQWVLELSDFGTTGLGGAIDPSTVPEEESTDFVDFMRNIGSPRDTDKGGGTYGYGKSSLYVLSKCSTIVVDTACEYRDMATRRVMAAQIGARYDIGKGDASGRYTGRHWWGVEDTEVDGIVPATGPDANEIAQALGMAERECEDYGTSILILDPDIDVDNPEIVVKDICSCLLWNFWPKLIPNNSAMSLKVKLNDENHGMPTPEECPPLGSFVKAMMSIKAKEGTEIWCHNPKKLLGHLSISKAPRMPRHKEYSNSGKGFPEASHHVALMRPAELVVKYLEGPRMPLPNFEWGGVFICDTDEEVEHAFADSEPPAHDDWIPAYLSVRRAKTFVNVALREIRKEITAEISGDTVAAEAGGLPLGRAADKLGDMLSTAVGDRTMVGGRTGHAKGRRASTRVQPGAPRISDVKFDSYETVGDTDCAVFAFVVTGPPGSKVRLGARTGILTDGNQSLEALPDGSTARVMRWSTEASEESGKDFDFVLGEFNSVKAAVSITNSLAVTFDPKIIGDDG